MENKRASFGLKILCFFIPLAGLIIYACNISTNKNFAKDCGVAALIGLFAPFVITISILFSLGIIKLSANTTINYLNSYLGEKIYYVPDLTGFHKNEAKSRLEELGLNMEILEYVESDIYPKDFVVSQNYQARLHAKQGTTIGVTISKGVQ